MKRKIQILAICAFSIVSIHFIQSQSLEDPDCEPGCACAGNKDEFKLHYDSAIYDCKVEGCNCWGSVD
jgi:hypothetical protein